MNVRRWLSVWMVALPLCLMSCSSRSQSSSANGSVSKPRIVTVAQSGSADFVGNDNVVLQKAADSLAAGDTLEIGPGTYQMENSLLIPSHVTVRGRPGGQTILRKSRGVESPLAEDGDYGESQLRVSDPQLFHPGMGLSVSDKLLNSGWDISVTSLKAVEGNLLRIEPMTLRDYSAEEQQAKVRNTFPILCAMDTDGVVFEHVTVDGNKAENAYLDGCRGGAIYLYRSKNAVIRNCVAHDYNGDGISFQITDNVQVLDSESYGHSGFGIHPGTGSPRAVVRNCRIHDNGQVGLFLCWRVRDGKFADNVIENNGNYGISIGHKDTDNIFSNNIIRSNKFAGVYFRKETFKNSGHRNSFNGNKILNNGNAKEGYGFYVEPLAGDLVISKNQIADTRTGSDRTQRYGIYKAEGAGKIELENNELKGHSEKDIAESRIRR